MHTAAAGGRWICRSITGRIIFFYDYLVRRVWIDENKRPIVKVTGSHKHSCILVPLALMVSNYSDSMTNSMAEINSLII